MVLRFSEHNCYMNIIGYVKDHLNVPENLSPHSSTLAWKIPWTEEPGRLQPTGSLGVGHD